MEIQIPEIKVTTENLTDYVDSGGGLRVLTAEITIDSKLPLHRQKEAVLHEVLGAYLGSVLHVDILGQIAEAQMWAIAEIEKIYKARE